jgi:prepilin peptidase CpaA
MTAIALVIGVIATAEDLARRRISNIIPLSALVCGLAYHCATAGLRGLGSALAGAACGFGLFVVFYWLGGMGGGDVKLMGGFGALLGPERVLEAGLWAAAAGGLLAAAVLLYCAVKHRWRKSANSGPHAIPYAPAIAVGVLLALVDG